MKRTRTDAYSLARHAFALYAGLVVLSSGTRLARANPADTAPLHVRGATRIEAHASRASGRVVLSGTVTDDVDQPEPGRVVVSLSREGGGAVSLSDAAPEACAASAGSSATGGSLPAPGLLGPDRLTVAVDPQGRFCTRLSLDADRYVARFESPGSERIDGAKAEWPFDLRNPPLSIVTIAFDTPRSIVSLDQAAADVEVVASIDEEGVVRGASGLRIALSNEAGDALGESTTAQSGHALFELPAERLGKLGPGELRASFAGDATASPSRCTLTVERTSRVTLALAGDSAGGTKASPARLEAADPEEGVAVPVRAIPGCAPAGCAGVATGAVEARLGDTVVGAATLEGGQATLVVTFARRGTSEVPLRLRYLPDAPWLVAGDEIEIILPVRGPSPVRGALLALGGVATAAWLLLGRIAPWRVGKGSAPPKEAGGAAAVAGVEVLAALPQGRGWTGTVIDTHEGTPIEGARIAVERRGFERIEVVAETRSEADGRFALGRVDPVPGDEITAEAPLHAPLRDALPGSGELRVALVLRRRAMLDRLVAWARKRGRPFDAKPDPTPGHVRRAAGAESPVGRWADAVERAAFGGEVVDARVHAELEKLEPEGGVETIPGPRGRA